MFWVASMGVLLSLVVRTSAEDSKVDFNRQIRPVLSENCIACHGPDEKAREAGLRLDTFAGATADHDGSRAIVPGDPKASELVHRIFETNPDDIMPPLKSHKELTTEQKNILVKWIEAGGNYDEHWAFVPPSKPELPESTGVRWGHNGIDRFVLADLTQRGLQPSEEAARETLIRRVTFDLTGLPPTPEEVDAFLVDDSPLAYEEMVDRLLASRHFGERMALAWMDASRYGDTSVMHADGPRYMWPWRDWVIDAYNSNKPFNEFTVEQIAGDLLPNATPEQKIATGFNRNHATSDEGGAIPEELRVEYVVDRVKTTSNVWLGLSMECAQCHDHKYDPISNKEYYEFFAYFNNSADPGMQTRNGNQSPNVDRPDPERDALLANIAERRAKAEAELTSRRAEVKSEVITWAANQRGTLADQSAQWAAAGQVHQMPLDEPADSAVSELVAGEQGTLTGKHEIEARDAGAGIKLDGSTVIDFKETGNFAEFDAPLTISAWVKAPKDASGAVLSRMDTANAYRGYDLWLQGGAVGTHIVNAWPDNALKVVAKKPLKPDAWQHIVMTYDGGGKAAGVKLFVDGEEMEYAVEADQLSATIKTEAPFRIGGRYGSGNVTCAVDDIRFFNRALSTEEVVSVKDSGNAIASLLAVPAENLTEEQRLALTNAFLISTNDARYLELTEGLKSLDGEKATVEKDRPIVNSMIMEDNPDDKMRVTYILDRGQYDHPRTDEPVQPGVPAALPPLPEGAPKNRLALAQWLISGQHPLTARVAVNRYWALLFGRGLVGTVSDFGSQGEVPSHPELLDWMAVDFMEHGWDIKRTLRQIVTSATYRQSSRIPADLRKADPENRWLARGSRFRLQGEFIRDGALAMSGLLVNEVGGPGVKPYQPDGLWNEVSLDGGLRFQRDSGEKLYRRSMYTYWKRSAPAPSMTIFDAPSREKCVVVRDRTNTPLQALVTLNDVQFIEAARVLAAQLLQKGSREFTDHVVQAFRLAVSRPPSVEEVATCRRVFEKQLASFKADPEAAEKYLTAGEAPRDPAIDAPELAALTVLVNMILNLDEFLTRG
jgi:mono/diheme cytochrome c family protein